ncbi:hypothetical protein, variant [Cladophialophora immunda]|nr:hypothetical protein, variant [Cladophialophora immunda]KIW23370.1 hypothetical protein, variant [Cladophialophora immunda]
MAKEPNVPRSFLVQVEIQRQVVQYSNALSGYVDSGTCCTLQNLFNNELDTLCSAYGDVWSPRLEIQHLGAKLYLLSLCLTVTSRRRSRPGDLDRTYATDLARVSIQLGLPSAVSLIHTISQLNRESATPGHRQGLVVHYPKFYFRLVVFAVVFLMKFLRAAPGAAREDRELASSHIATAHRLFASFGPARDFVRVAEVMADMARNLGVDDAPRDSADAVETRLGASLLYDTMGRLRGSSRRSGESDDGSAPSAASAGIEARGSDDAGTVLHNAAEMDFSLWCSPGTSSNAVSEPQPNLEDGLDCFRWMSDDMLAEMLNL